MKIIVGVSDMRVSNTPEATLTTFSLGSCIGVAIYDPYVKVGGLLHFMLPEAALAPEKAEKNPFMFADTGIPALFKAVFALGAQKSRIKVGIVGGAQIMDQNAFFNIGHRNYLAVRKIFLRNNIFIHSEDVGGTQNRTLTLHIDTGTIKIKKSGNGEYKL